MPDELKKFSLEDLAEFDGSQGQPVYIAFQGKVYDVSGSGLWDAGQHMAQHTAGGDLTSEFPDAPHGEEVFTRYPQVGVLEARTSDPAPPEPQALSARERWQRFMHKVPLLRRHPHPMLVHFPIVFMIAATAFTLLYLFTGLKSFEVTGFHCLGGGVLFTPPTILTGWFTWWLNYESRWLKPIVIKVILSPLLLLLGTAAFIWRWLEPDILAGLPHWPGLVYLALICSLTPLVAIIGACGAELTFPVHSE